MVVGEVSIGEGSIPQLTIGGSGARLKPRYERDSRWICGMNYLLDTCVVSELISKQPMQQVVDWIDGIDAQRLFLSVVTIGEIQRGIVKLPD